MQIKRLDDISEGNSLRADLVIVGAGPVGLTIARECAQSGRRVIVLESGLEEEDEDHAKLVEMENIGFLNDPKDIEARIAYHQIIPRFWSQRSQPFGVACRGFGGSSQAWAGKSAAFDPIDLESRPWVPLSDWPLSHDELQPYLARARARLNLIDESQPEQVRTDGVKSFYWQFARSRYEHTDVMRMGREFLCEDPPGIEVLLDATVTHIALRPDGRSFEHLSVESIGGKKLKLFADQCVLAANAIENPRLLLASRDVHRNGIGNMHDTVGRYLMDHPSSIVGAYRGKAAAEPGRVFGFSARSRERRAYMYLHGLALNEATQREEELLNAALFFIPELSDDDPWEAFKRLAKLKSPAPLRDLGRTVGGMGMLIRALGTKALQHPRTPDWVKSLTVNAVMRFRPNLVATEFASKGLPKKLDRLAIRVLCEQIPDRESRVTLSDRTDRFGIPLARVDWKVSELERKTLWRLTQLARDAVVGMGLPEPELEPWVHTGQYGDAAIIDMAHPMGTTRISGDPRTGVVDADCRVHGVDNLYLAGGSVFPTAGHTNPTYMFVAMAIRLSDTLNRVMRSKTPVAPTVEEPEWEKAVA